MATEELLELMQRGEWQARQSLDLCMTELLLILTVLRAIFGLSPLISTVFVFVAAQSPNFFSNCYILAYLKGIIYSNTFNMTDGLYF
jgi:hypothetical protein